jgi:hypothetical protein
MLEAQKRLRLVETRLGFTNRSQLVETRLVTNRLIHRSRLVKTRLESTNRSRLVETILGFTNRSQLVETRIGFFAVATWDFSEEDT